MTTEEAREADPTDEELFAMFNSTDGDSSYDGWLAIYRAGVVSGIRQAREALTEEVRTKWVNHPSRDGVRVAVPSERRFVTGWEPIDAVGKTSCAGST